MSDTATLVLFESGYVEDGVGQDGLPVYHETVMIQLDRPPLLSLRRVATEEDFEAYPEQFKLYTKQQAAKRPSEATVDGYPLIMWPVPTMSELKMCIDRDITTVQQLAALAKRPDRGRLPPQILELSKRAEKMVELTGKVGKFEKIISGLTAERDALAEQIKECNATISAQNSLIEALKARAA